MDPKNDRQQWGFFLNQRLKHQKNTEKTPRRKLVGGFNPSEKYARQIGSFPQVRVKIKKK